MLAINLTRLIFLFIGLNLSFSFHLLKNNYVKFPSSSKLQISPSLFIPYTKLTEVSTISLSSLIIKSRFTNFKLDSTQTSFLLSIIYSLLRKVSIDNSNILIQTYAWSYFLQSSLMLNILSTSSSSTNRNKSATKSQTQNSLNYKHLLFTFILASLGSFIGAIISFYLTKTLFSPTVINNLEHIIVPIAASLAASYIGGTANYFEVANILSQNSDRPFNSNTINLVAGIDITIMVLFFNILMLIQKSNLNEWLSPKVLGNNLNTNKTEAFVIDSNADFKTNNSFQLKYFFRVIKLIILSLVVSVISNSLQKKLSIQGASVILTIVFSLFIRNFIPKSEIILSEFTDLSSKASEFMLCMFYATIGMNSNLKDIPSVGLPIIFLIGCTLSVHLFTILIGSKAWNILIRYIKKDDNYSIDIDKAVLASNAAVGGPATASAMAMQINRQDLMLPSSCIGIVGYLIGTPLGLFLAKFLRFS